MPATDLSKEQILEILRPVIEPTLQTSIVELGMVRATSTSGDTLALEIELLTPLHPLRDQIDQGVRAAADGAGFGKTVITWSHRVRSSGAGRSDAEPLKGVKNVVAIASGKG